jgi:hypothetical protein
MSPEQTKFNALDIDTRLGGAARTDCAGAPTFRVTRNVT